MPWVFIIVLGLAMMGDGPFLTSLVSWTYLGYRAITQDVPNTNYAGWVGPGVKYYV